MVSIHVLAFEQNLQWRDWDWAFCHFFNIEKAKIHNRINKIKILTYTDNMQYTKPKGSGKFLSDYTGYFIINKWLYFWWLQTQTCGI